jgi:hypothetical protein
MALALAVGLRHRDLGLHLLPLGVLLRLLHLDFREHALLDRMQIILTELDVLELDRLDDEHRVVFQRPRSVWSTVYQLPSKSMRTIMPPMAATTLAPLIMMVFLSC